MKKTILSTILCLTLVLTVFILLPTEASAATSGTCGDNLTWTLDNADTLTISGTGAMAQMYFDYNTENLANTGMTGTAAAAIPDTAKELSVADNLNGVNFYGASLVYRDKIAVRFYFTGDVTGLTFMANGDIYAPVAREGMYYIEVSDILPQNLDQQITLTATDVNGNALSVTYGPMNYIVRMTAKGDENTKNLLKALYNYHLAAKAL